MDDFITHYNERRLHWSLDIDNHQTPPKAFHDKAAHGTIRVDNPNWMEVDIHGWQADKRGEDIVLLQYKCHGDSWFFFKLGAW